MTRSRAIGALIVLLLVSTAFADVRVFVIGGRLRGDERATCQIQARGLPAGHQLAASMRDIHTLLTFPPSPGAPPVPPPIARVVQSLNRHLALYLRAEASQPQTRHC